MSSVASSEGELDEDYPAILSQHAATATSPRRSATSLKQPFLESYFPPLAPSQPAHSEENQEHPSSKSLTKARKRVNPAKRNNSTPSLDDDNIKTAIMLKNRDLEIYVTLPSAEKRLFVDVQEEVSVPLSSPSSSSSSHRAKRPKLNTQKGDSEKSKSSLSIASSAAASSSKLTSASSHSSKVAQTSSKIGPSPLGPKDPNAVTPAASSTAATVPAKDKDAANSRTIPSQKMKNTDSSAPRIPYATFEHVKLNVRVRPPVAKKEKENGKASSGITVEALSKTSIHPKIIDRFSIRILGSTTRPTAQPGLQDTFDLSVQGCTEIASLLVLLYTRLKLSNPRTFSSLELNALRLWHLDEDRLIRLSSGNIAGNNITPKSILCYSIGKRTGKSFVSVYADGGKVDRVEVDVELSRVWQCKEKPKELEESKPNNAPRRQLFKYKHDLHGTSRSSKRNQKPYSTSFALPLLGELNCSETPLDIALEQARREHQERTADKKRRREAREEERRKEIARLEKERRRLQKKKKRLTAGSTADENLATDGLAAVHTVPEEMPSPTTHESGLRFDSPSAPQYDSLEESDWSSNCFVEDWYADDNNHLSDHCDEEMAFTPYDDRIPMKDSVLLSTAIRENPVDEDASEEVEVAGATAGEMPVTPIQQGLEHILSSLGIPSSAREPFIQDMVKTVSVFPYIAVRLIGYEDLVHALNVEARYSPKDEEGTYWDIRDIQQVCLQYKGIWKSEVEDWKKGCEAFTEVDWAKVALKGWITDDRPSYTDSESEAGAAQASTSAASARRIVTRSVAAGIATAADLTTAATAVSNTTAEGPATTAIAATASSATPGPATITSIRTSLTPAQRFLEYRSRTKHRRGRLCPNCEMEFCNHSRHIEIEECDCGECDGDDADEDEFYKYYEEHQELEADDASASSQSSTSSESATTPNETVSSVMVPGHRARVVQCIYMEAF